MAADALSNLDVSEPHRNAEDSWRPTFALLRDQTVHYCPDSVNGPYWSVTSALIKSGYESPYLLFREGGMPSSAPTPPRKGLWSKLHHPR